MADLPDVFSLTEHPVHLGLGAHMSVEPRFTGEMAWYEGYGRRHASDGIEGRLVASHAFSESWDSWEMHPEGDELVVCLRGRITLIQEQDGQTRSLTLGPGQAAINPPGVWHTADVDEPVEALFITAGAGTQHRPR